jgi:hypothetical protein
MFQTLRADELYLYALMDDQTRFWIAQQVAETKYTSNVRPLLENAKEHFSSQMARQIFMMHS